MSFSSTFLKSLYLLFGRKVRLDGTGSLQAHFWLLLLINAAVSFAYDFLDSQAPRYFDANGLQSDAFIGLLFILLGTAASRVYRDPALLWRLPALVLAASLVIDLITAAFYLLLLPRLGAGDSVYYLIWMGSLVWLLLVVITALRSLGSARGLRRHLAVASLFIATLAGSMVWLQMNSYWVHDYYAAYEQAQAREPTLPPLSAEKLLFQQASMLDSALDALQAQRPGETDMYFVSFGSYGDEAVFRREVDYSSQLFRHRFAGEGRVIALANHRDSIDRLPLATATNLDAALARLAAIMDMEEDVLFLFLTSHGSEQHALAVTLGDVQLDSLSADRLAAMLERHGFKWRVVVVSACYSGGFVAPLSNDETLVITAASAETTSFGCSDEAEMTYFGRAFFRQALNETRRLPEAFEIAKKQIEQWEAEEEITPSLPQIFAPDAIRQKLASWHDGLPPVPAEAHPARSGGQAGAEQEPAGQGGDE